MRTWQAVIVGIVVILLGVAAIGVAFMTNRPPERKPPQNLAMLVDTIPVTTEDVVFSVNSQGLVEPRTETTLVSEVGGKIESISPKLVAGGFFKRGEVLLTIDQSDYQTAARRAEASLASRRAQLSQAQAQTDQARKDWNKLNPGRGEPNDLVLRLPQLEDAEANVRAAEADLAKARRDLERTRVRAPYDGIVKEKRVDLGQFVSPGTPVALVAGVEVAEIRLPIADSELAYLPLPRNTRADTGLDIPVTLQAATGGQQQIWQASITRTEGVIDRSTRQIYAVAQVEDPYRLQSDGQPLRFGTFVDATIQGIQADDVKALPRYTLRPDGTVLIATEENTLEVRPVDVSRSTPETVYISSGLEAGDRVITTAIEAPIPGTEVMSREDEARRVAQQRQDRSGDGSATESAQDGSAESAQPSIDSDGDTEVADLDTATDGSEEARSTAGPDESNFDAGLMDNLNGETGGSDPSGQPDETGLAAEVRTELPDSDPDTEQGESLDDLKQNLQNHSGNDGEGKANGGHI